MSTSENFNKNELSEQDICTKFITPSLINSNWDIISQISEQKSFTSGEIVVDEDENIYREEYKRYDYLLSYKPGVPLAIIEAKDNNHSVGDGMQQAIQYAEILDVPFAYSTNGDGYIEHDRTVVSGVIEKEISLEDFPSPQELWERFKKWKNISKEQEDIITQEYYVDESGKAPRYYQRIAINRVIEAVTKNDPRILLVMATGSGKTYVASQIIWRLWKSKTKKRILFLADRNILLDQTMTNDFKHFKDKMTKITGREVDKSYEIYLALYQGVTGKEDFKNIYKSFSPGFFDLIIVDECHRGSISEDSQWHDILQYFDSATQIGLTATPKDEKGASNIDYFGEPVYTYSLKQGIEDGFLAPYKVINVQLDIDEEGWKPEEGQEDRYGNEIEERTYKMEDYDDSIVIDNRTKVIAKRVSEYLKETDRFSKTIIFCVDRTHAERMRRAMVNENSDLYNKNSKYVVRITGDDKIGKLELDNFIDPREDYPVVVTSSKLMTTGVDAQTCKLIVIDRNIRSLTDFKQIIGRGTRVNEENNKYYFTILDFRNATEHFLDPNFDGDPMDYTHHKGSKKFTKNDTKNKKKPKKGIIIKSKTKTKEKLIIDNVSVSIKKETISFYDKDGSSLEEKNVTKEFFEKIFEEQFGDREKFITSWQGSNSKSEIAVKIQELGININRINSEFGNEYDIFDIICNLIYDSPLRTRSQRAEKVMQSDYFTSLNDDVKYILGLLLEKYVDLGVDQLENINILRVNPFNEFGSPIEIIQKFGSRQEYLGEVTKLINEIYSSFGEESNEETTT